MYGMTFAVGEPGSDYVERNPFLEWDVYPPIIIIEPGDLDTSESVDPAMRVIDDVALRMAAQMGMNRVSGRLAKQSRSWSEPRLVLAMESLTDWYFTNAMVVRMDAITPDYPFAEDSPTYEAFDCYGCGNCQTCCN